MKTRAALILTAMAFAAAPFATAQENSQRVRRVPVPPSRPQPQMVQNSAPTAADGLLTKNVSIILAGVVGDNIPLDITLTGCSSRVNSDFVLEGGEIPTIASISYVIREASGKFTVTYKVSLRLPVVTSTNGNNKNISFQEALLENTVHCNPGKSVEVYRSGKNTLSLTIAEAPRD